MLVQRFMITGDTFLVASALRIVVHEYDAAVSLPEQQRRRMSNACAIIHPHRGKRHPFVRVAIDYRWDAAAHKPLLQRATRQDRNPTGLRVVFHQLRHDPSWIVAGESRSFEYLEMQ